MTKVQYNLKGGFANFGEIVNLQYTCTPEYLQRFFMMMEIWGFQEDDSLANMKQDLVTLRQQRESCVKHIEDLLSSLKICYDNFVTELQLDESKTEDFDVNEVLECMMRIMQLINKVHLYWQAKSDKELQ